MSKGEKMMRKQGEIQGITRCPEARIQYDYFA